MKIQTIKIVGILCSLIACPNQIAFSSNKPKKKAQHRYYQPVAVFEKGDKKSQSIGTYKRAQIGKNGAYGTFTKKGTPLSQTVLEHNPTTAPIAGVTDKKALGYIINMNTNAGIGAGAPSYLSLYPYPEPILLKAPSAVHKPSMKMKTSQYIQKN